jgi:hypothetical protein
LTSTPCKRDATASKLSSTPLLWVDNNEEPNAIASDNVFSAVSICFAGSYRLLRGVSK